MLKLLVSAIAVTSTASALVRPEPAFTLRDPRQMARPTLDVHDGTSLPGDPKPKRPPPPPPPAVQQKPAPGVLQKPAPVVMQKPAPLLLRDRHALVPGEHSRPGFIRALHGHDDHRHSDHHSDDHHHDDHHMSPHSHAKPSPVHTAPSHAKPSPVHTDEDDWIFPYHHVKPSGKPVPGVSAGGLKPKPKPKPKPDPKTKPKPPTLHSLASSSRVDNAYAGVQQQCEMDYAQICQRSFSEFDGGGSIVSLPPFAMSPQIPMDTLVMDFFIVDESTEITPPRSPFGTRQTTSHGDDDWSDDDSNDDDTWYDDDDDYDDDDSDDDNGVNMGRVFEIFMGGARRRLGEAPPRVLWARDHASDDPELILGFGREGDMCLRLNSERLSRSCQSSLAELEEAAVAYDLEDEDGCHMLPIFITLLLIGLVVRFAARRRMKKRLDSLQTTLSAIHASPELKAKVEAASGVPLPPRLPACRMAQKPWYVKVMCVLGVFVVSVIVVANAFLITGFIVSLIVSDNVNDDDSYADAPSSPWLVLPILFAVLTLEIIVIKKMKSAICAYLDSQSDSSVTASSGTSQGVPGSGASLPQIFQRIRSVQLSTLLPARFRQSPTGEGPQYEPLLSEDNYQDECTEMSSMPAHLTASAPPAAVSTIPVVITPVTYASPSVQGSISML